MSFFESEVVRSEMAEIAELQEDVYQSIFKFPSMGRQERLEHVELLEKLLEKQKVLYTRLSLSDDPEAVEMKNKIIHSAQMMGLPANMDMNIIFNNMTRVIDAMKQSIDRA
jgi:hypothetical protein